jgi:hypothetical protein
MPPPAIESPGSSSSDWIAYIPAAMAVVSAMGCFVRAVFSSWNAR